MLGTRVAWTDARSGDVRNASGACGQASRRVEGPLEAFVQMADFGPRLSSGAARRPSIAALFHEPLLA